MSVSEYKLEMHLHTKGNSPCGHTPPSEIIKVYKEAGYDGIVCTNHFNRYLYENYLEGKNAAEKFELIAKAMEKVKNSADQARYADKLFFDLEIDRNYYPWRLPSFRWP